MSLNHSILSLLFLLIISSCHVGRTIIWNFGDYDDYKKFDSELISNGSEAFKFKSNLEENQKLNLSAEIFGAFLINNSFEEFLVESKSTSFIVLKQDSILYSSYLNGYEKSDLHCINSVSKSFISLLIGIAHAEGKINSLQDPISDYITEFKSTELGQLTIEDIIDMKSGIKFSEQYYNPFGNLSKFYYGKHLRKYIRKVSVEEPPGKFNYISVNTDILGWILERAVNQSVPKYLEEKVWIPLGMEYEATWSLDSKKNKVPKYSYGLNTRSIDLLKLGYLYANNGEFNGKKIIDNQWINVISQIDSSHISQPNYKNHWWRDIKYSDELSADEINMKLEQYENIEADGSMKKSFKIYTGNYYAAGFLGQFIFVNPAKKIVVVRTGKKQGKTNWVRLLQLITEYIE